MRRAIIAVFFLAAAGAVCPAASAPTGGELFMQHCAQCHGADGNGGTPAGRKLRVTKLPRTKFDAGEIARRITEGVRTAKGVERMPAFGARLTPEEIQAVTEAVLRLKK